MKNIANKSLVRLRHVRCDMAQRTLLALDALDIHAGERVAIVGHNGAGKSTLLKLLSGLFPISQGEVEVLGQRLYPGMPRRELHAVRARVGHVWQGTHLVGRLSAQENTLMGVLGRRRGWRTWLRWYDMSDQIAAHTALSRVGMAHLCQARCDRLSGGEQQKVAMARLLMQAPELVLADEPTAALDPAAAAQSCALLRQIAASATLITVVHNTTLLPLLADRVIGLRQGRLMFDLPLSQVDDAMLHQLYHQA